MKITDCFSRQIIEGFKPPENSVLISIRDPGTEKPDLQPGWEAVLSLDFWDINRGEGLSTQLAGYTDDKSPSLDNAHDIYVFIYFNHNKNIYAHCEAGISRSGAVREFLNRMGWVVGHEHWLIHPNQTVLSDLMAAQSKLGLLVV